MNDIDEFCPVNRQDWRDWLQANHKDEQAIWLIFYKKNSPKYNLSWSDAVDEALCFGWIDSVKYPVDDMRFKQYFSKRKPKSVWSKINKDKVEQLMKDDLMTEAGLKCIEIAKENGQWTALDAVESLEIPADLQSALNEHKGAKAFFEGLNKSTTKHMLYWIHSAKRPETRAKRVKEIVDCAKLETKPKLFR